MLTHDDIISGFAKFEIGKDELRYRAGASKGYKWLVVDLSGGTIELQTIETAHSDSKHDSEFILVDNDGRAWNLRAQSREDALSWVKTITTRTQVEDLNATKSTA